jgi:hypothetical protein
MCIVLGGQFCSILQVMCFHLWLNLSLDFKVTCWFFVIESLSNPFCYHFSCALRTCVICNVQPNWRYVWWSTLCQMPKGPILMNDVSLDIKVNCWSSMIGNSFNPFCYHFSYALKTYVICKAQVICLFNQIEGFCHGLFNVKCSKAQFWGNRLLRMWVVNKD